MLLLDAVEKEQVALPVEKEQKRCPCGGTQREESSWFLSSGRKNRGEKRCAAAVGRSSIRAWSGEPRACGSATSGGRQTFKGCDGSELSVRSGVRGGKVRSDTATRRRDPEQRMQPDTSGRRGCVPGTAQRGAHAGQGAAQRRGARS